MLSYAEVVSHPGNVELRRALELSVLATMRGQSLHVHAEGLRGTGKTTVMRAAAGLLGTIRRVAGCPYNCSPSAPHCPLHRDLPADALQRLGSEVVPRPFLEISASAKIGTVVGSIDLGRLTAPDRAEAALLPGTLARAHRGIVFVDEVNRLADTSPELADALLDLMGTKPGRLQIEEAGLPPVVLRLQVTVWAASNPDEEPGPLADVRRQLADRFDLAVAMRRPVEPVTVMAVLRRADETVSAESSALPPPSVRALAPTAGAAAVGDPGQTIQDRAAGRPPELGDELRLRLARLYCDFQLESLRAVQAWQLAACLQALREGRDRVVPADLSLVAPSVLRHRLEAEELARLLDAVEDDGRLHAGSLGAAFAGEAGDDGGEADSEDRAVLAPHPGQQASARTSSAAAYAAPVPAASTAAAPAPPSSPRRRLASLADWWRRMLAVRRGLSENDPPAARTGAALTSPEMLPPITPRLPARLLSDLPADALWTRVGGDGP